MQFNISPSVAELSPAFHYLSSFPTTADIIIIEVIKVDDIDKGYSRYVASVELNHLNDLLDDTTSLLSTNQGSWFCLGLPVSLLAGWLEITTDWGHLHDLKILGPKKFFAKKFW